MESNDYEIDMDMDLFEFVSHVLHTATEAPPQVPDQQLVEVPSPARSPGLRPPRTANWWR